MITWLTMALWLCSCVRACAWLCYIVCGLYAACSTLTITGQPDEGSLLCGFDETNFLNISPVSKIHIMKRCWHHCEKMMNDEHCTYCFFLSPSLVIFEFCAWMSMSKEGIGLNERNRKGVIICIYDLKRSKSENEYFVVKSNRGIKFKRLK